MTHDSADPIVQFYRDFGFDPETAQHCAAQFRATQRLLAREALRQASRPEPIPFPAARLAANKETRHA